MVCSVYLLDAAHKTDRAFDYVGIDGCAVGSVVTVPFGRANKPANAVVTEVRGDTDETKLKRVLSVSDTASLDREMLELAFFVREHTVCTLGAAVRCMIPPDALSRFVKRYSVNPDADAAETVFEPAASAVLDFVRLRRSVTAQNVADRLGDEAAAILPSLVKKGFLLSETVDREPTHVL